MKDLTDKQRQVLAVIREHCARHGQSPTVREIGREIEVASSCTVQRHLDALEKKGHITRDRYKYRCIRLVGEPSPDVDERVRLAVNATLERVAQACAGAQLGSASVRYAELVRSFMERAE